MSTLRSRIGHNQPDRLAFERSAPIRNKALCAGVDPFVARMTGALPAKPQPHYWWPVGRRGALCLRCSEYRRDG